jgi:hypothetical protein
LPNCFNRKNSHPRPNSDKHSRQTIDLNVLDAHASKHKLEQFDQHPLGKYRRDLYAHNLAKDVEAHQSKTVFKIIPNNLKST